MLYNTNMQDAPYQHTPAMVLEAIKYLSPAPGGILVDATLGGGGHALALAKKLFNPQVAISKLYVFDRDSDAIAAAKERLKGIPGIIYVRDNFSSLKKHIPDKINGILFDLGVSSYQIDAPRRGFSLQKDGPLDMRMDQSQKLTAGELINGAPAKELEQIFFEYGEERFSRRIAKAVIASRPLSSTGKLREIIEKAVPTWKKRETVTRIFQALRIAVNHEPDNLAKGIAAAVALLAPQGRIAVISYHSLEDRLVKHSFRGYAKDGILKVLTRKPLLPGKNERDNNPRSRSAKMRVAEKI